MPRRDRATLARVRVLLLSTSGRPFVNPHYLETDPAMAPGSETRDMRIAEYHVVRENAVVGIEEGAMVRIEDDGPVVRGAARAKLFRRGQAAAWVPAGSHLPL
jgi:hypothetical protein